MPTANINILAVLVAAVLTFVLGAVWYSPVLFAKQWMAAQGYTPEKLEEMKRRGVTRAYAVSVLCYLVTAYVMALLASYTNSTTLARAVARVPHVARFRGHRRAHRQHVIGEADRRLGARRGLSAGVSGAHGRAALAVALSTRTALVAGASGLVGSQVLRLLLEDPAYSRVTLLARRELPLSHKKLEQRVVSFDRLAQIADLDRKST